MPPKEVLQTEMSEFNVKGWTEVDAMNALQGAGGIISDECVMWEDVAAENQAQAIEWLKENLSGGVESSHAANEDRHVTVPHTALVTRANSEGRTDNNGTCDPSAQNSPAMDSVPCKKCQMPIVFLKSRSSTKFVPVDASTISGRVFFYDPKAGHISHFATCSAPELFRNK